MMKSIRNLFWYPPAETKIPLSAFLSILLPAIHDFKDQLCNYLQVENCVLGNSGRELLYLLLKELYNRSGRTKNEVLIPGYTCYSVAASVAKADLKIIAYDLDPVTLNPDLESVERATSDRTLAIISQHLFGIPSPVDKINKIAQEKGAYHIEDAAQALGAKIDNRFLGTIGHFGLFSFGRGKPLPVGGGGAIVSKEEAILKEMVIKKRNVGHRQIALTAAARVVSIPQLYWIAEILPLKLGETLFDTTFDVSGLTVLLNKLLTNSFKILDGLNLHRNQIANMYKNVFVNGWTIPISQDGCPTYVRFPVLIGVKINRNQFRRLGVRRMYPNAIINEKAIQPYISEHQAPTRGAEEIAKSLITLPSHLGINNDLAIYIASRILKEI